MHVRSLVRHVTIAFCCLSLPAAACRPFGSYEFAEDAGGGIWFTEGDNNAVSRLAPDGEVKAYALPTPHAEPSSVAVDRRGDVWFVESEGRKIGRIGRDGRITEYPANDGMPFSVAVDPRGDAWFTQMADHDGGDHAGHRSPGVAKIGRIDRRGRMHSYPLAEGWPSAIAFVGGQVWVAVIVPGSEKSKPKGRLVRLSGGGRWVVEAAWDSASCPRNLVAGASGNMYFSDGCRGVTGFRAPSGRLTEWQLPQGVRIQQMSLGRDGTLWFTDRTHIGRIDRRGNVAFVDRPANGDATMAVLATRSGDVVFSEFYNYNINRLTKGGEFVEHIVGGDERRDGREVKDDEVCYLQFAARIAAKAQMDRKRGEEIAGGTFKPDGAGTEKLVKRKCLVCHDARRLLLSRRSDWTANVARMQSYMGIRGVPPLTDGELATLIRYFNENYGLR